MKGSTVYSQSLGFHFGLGKGVLLIQGQVCHQLGSIDVASHLGLGCGLLG